MPKNGTIARIRPYKIHITNLELYKLKLLSECPGGGRVPVPLGHVAQVISEQGIVTNNRIGLKIQEE